MDMHERAKSNKRQRGSRVEKRSVGVGGGKKVISIVRTTVRKPDGTFEISVDGIVLVPSKQVG